MSFTRDYALRDQALTRDQTRGVFGQVMGLVALTVGCTALGAYIGRNLSGGTGILFFFVAIACVFGLQFASAQGREQLAITLLFGLGFFIGMAVGPVLAVYVSADPAAVWQAAGATALMVAGLGAAGAHRVRADRDLRRHPRGQRDLRGGRPGDLRRVHVV